MEISKHILLVDKPVGITSFDVIRQLRQQLGVRKMGHAGTLDPRASGLMVIGVGEGTKQLAAYVKLDKEYVAEILVGERRSTGDMEGEVLESTEVHNLDAASVEQVLAAMIGTLTLPVSAYSAIKKDGVPMYKRARAAARQGETIEDVPVRDMVVHDATVLGIETGAVNSTAGVVVTVRFMVGSGTYIRSLAEEFGRRLGYPATLYALLRTRVGEFSIEDAKPLNEIRPAA